MIKFTHARTVFAAVIACLPLVMQAQVIQSNIKNNAVDYERLSKIDGLVNDYISKNWLTGAVSIVIKDNQVVQYKGYGYSDMSSK